MSYLEQLWLEVKANDVEAAKAFKIIRAHFKHSTLHTFRWLKEPKHVFCTWHQPKREMP